MRSDVRISDSLWIGLASHYNCGAFDQKFLLLTTIKESLQRLPRNAADSALPLV
jgi:hypothetical protein